MGLFSVFSKSADAPSAGLSFEKEEGAAAPTEQKFNGQDLIEFSSYQSITSVSMTAQAALQVPAVLCAVRVISEGVSGMPVTLKEKYKDSDGKAKLRDASDHWFARLMSKPNSWQTPAEFIEGMTICAALADAGLALKNTVGRQVRELLPVAPGTWTVEQDRDYRILYRVHHMDGSSDVFTQDQVLVLRGPSLDGYRGLAATRLAAEAIGLSASLASQQARLADNGGQPSGVLTAPSAKITPEVLKKVATHWRSKFGAGGPGGVAILDEGWSFKAMTMSSVDAQVLESRRFQIEEIARAFRVLPLKLMQADKAATFASVEQMQRIHVLDTLMPWVNRWEQALHRDVLGSAKDLVVDFDESLLLRGDHKDQAEFWQKALGAGGVPGFMTVNEVREERGLPPIQEAWADQIPRGSQSENLQNAPSPSGQERPAPASVQEDQ